MSPCCRPGGWWLPIYFEIGYKYPMLMSFNAQGVPQRLTRIGARKRSLQPTLVPRPRPLKDD